MTSFLLVVFGFVLLVLETAVATLVPLSGFTPNSVLPITLFLGVSANVTLVRGALVSFALGYLLDSFCGNPMGLQTFVLTASFIVARGAGLRLLPQGALFQVLLTFLMAMAFGATVLALRAIFEQPSVPALSDTLASSAGALLRAATATALIGPPVFAGTRRLEALGSPKREERTVSS